MIDINVYKFIHFIGIVGLLMSLGSIAAHRMQHDTGRHPNYRIFAITHGMSMFFLLLGGFGMLARLSIHFPWPGWIMVKFGVWIVFGGLIALLKRNSGRSKSLWALTIALGILATYMGIFKPF